MVSWRLPGQPGRTCHLFSTLLPMTPVRRRIGLGDCFGLQIITHGAGQAVFAGSRMGIPNLEAITKLTGHREVAAGCEHRFAARPSFSAIFTDVS